MKSIFFIFCLILFCFSTIKGEDDLNLVKENTQMTVKLQKDAAENQSAINDVKDALLNRLSDAVIQDEHKVC